jgi:hypothetical protein
LQNHGTGQQDSPGNPKKTTGSTAFQRFLFSFLLAHEKTRLDLQSGGREQEKQELGSETAEF